MKNIAMMIMILLLTNCNNKHQNQRLSSILVNGIPEYIENHILINTSK